MGYMDELLANNETVVYETRKHWVAPLFATVTGTLLTVGGLAALIGQLAVAPGFFDNLLMWGGLIAMLVGLVMLARTFVEWWSEGYYVTNQKVLKVSGILHKSAEGSALEKINDITIHQSLLGRWLNYGTLRVLTAADESNLNYSSMRDPMVFRRTILDQKQLFEQSEARQIADAVRQTPVALPPAAPVEHRARPAESGGQSAQEITDLIDRLSKLRDSGAITQAEFEAKKTDLLGRI